jgi:predicted enzyme related to lactoylglutathione lyase
MSPTLANGKVCYVEIPAIDVELSAAFYRDVFGWQIRQRGDGNTAFDDTTGEVSGAWVTGRSPAAEPGLLLYIWVDDAAAAVDAVIAHGGEIVQPIGIDAPEITARFRDPAGNVVGLYQEPEPQPEP